MDIRTPVRASHSYTQHLVAPPRRVFPLLCPVRETEWVRGWAPRAVITASGRAEAGCVFFTPGSPAESVWVVTEYRPDANRIAFVKLTPGHTVGDIRIRLRPAEDGGTLAEVAYTFTALAAEGECAVREFTAEAYADFMRDWEDELNHFLRTGEMLPQRPEPRADASG